MFSQQISQQELAVLCRSLATPLQAGVDVIRTFRLTASKSQGKVRVLLEDVVAQLREGVSLTEAFRAHQPRVPELFCDLLHVAEQSGNIPEVLRELADHYENNVRLWRTFLSQITLPVIQLVVAILLIAGLIYLMEFLAEMAVAQGGKPLDLLGWGLKGTTGALTWLGGWVMGGVSLYVIYQFASRSLAGAAAIHRMLLAIPIVGSCLRAFAIARFSWAFHLTQGAGMPIQDSLESSLRATGNGAFIQAASQIVGDVQAGATLTEAIAASRLFPTEFVHIVDIGETSGTVPETLGRLGEQFEEDARRSLANLSMAAAWAIWSGVSLFIIYLIFKLAMFYLGIVSEALNELR
jgi:type IV pilus assembly protein PilC